MAEPRLVGAYGGRVWHYAGTQGRTRCGLIVNGTWQPRTYGKPVGTCTTCKRLAGGG
jgi:hypothetical protein